MRLRRSPVERLIEVAGDYAKQQAEDAPEATQEAARAIIAGGGVLVVSVALHPVGVAIEVRAVQKGGPSVPVSNELIAEGGNRAGRRLK